jgi:hypothetical protein
MGKREGAQTKPLRHSERHFSFRFRFSAPFPRRFNHLQTQPSNVFAVYGSSSVLICPFVTHLSQVVCRERWSYGMVTLVSDLAHSYGLSAGFSLI